MGDSQILETRIRHSKYDGANGLRPKKLLSQVLKIVSLLEEGSVEDVETAYSQFCKDMELYKFSMGKIQIVAETSIREIQNYRELREELKTEMTKTEAEIEKLKEKVAHERVVRQNKEEYAALARQVELLAPKSKTEKDKATMQEEINKLEEQTQAQSQRTELRKKQLLLLLHVVEELKRNMDDDDDLALAPMEGVAADAEGAALVTEADVEMGEAEP